MDVIFQYLSGIPNLSLLNAVLLCGVIWMVRYRINEILNDLYWTKKQLREHELTFVKYTMTVEREPERNR